MSELIKMKSGEPFKNRKAANLQKGRQLKLGVETQIVEVEGGFALEKLGVKRKKRIPMGTRDRLRYPERKGYKRRVFNDDHDRIQRALDAGYEFVSGNHPGGDPIAGKPSQQGSKIMKEVGGGIKGYLMEIPEEFYEEDQKAKQDEIDRQEAYMHRKRTDGVGDLYGEVKTTQR